MAAALKWHWRRLVGASLLVLAAAHVAPRFVRGPDLDENRRLAGAPAWPPTGLDSFRKVADAWVADHFPPRPHLIGALNWLRLQAGVSGSPRVIVGRDGWLFYDSGTHLADARGARELSDGEVADWLSALAGRSEWLRAQGIAYVVLVPPDKETLFAAHGPWWFNGPALNRPAVTLSRLAQASSAGQVLYLHDALARPTRWGLQTYVRNETHWTGPGAYLGYQALMRSLQAQGLTDGPRPPESFAEVDTRAVNKPRNLALMLGVASFVDATYPALEDRLAIHDLTVTWLGPRRDWTAPQVIETGQAGKPVLLMTMDSFSNALLPFLYGHFSRIVLAHNQDGAWRPDLIARFKPDIVVTEAVESGLTPIMREGPEPSDAVRARIAAVVARRDDYRLPPRRIMQRGGGGDDRLGGWLGDDVLTGGPGADTVEGLSGNDTLRGGRGPDRVEGGPGDDWIAGGREDDVLSGGAGADVFNSFAGAGTDVVTDFNAAEGDRVELDPGVAFTVRQEGPDTVVVMDGARLILKGVAVSSLKPRSVRNR